MTPEHATPRAPLTEDSPEAIDLRHHTGGGGAPLASLAAPSFGGGSHVLRPRLAKQIEAAVRSPLTVLTAPPGYGKTAALGHWLARHDGPRVLQWSPVPDGPLVDDRQRDRLRAEAAGGAEVLVAIDGLDGAAPDDRSLDELLEDLPTGIHLVLARRGGGPASIERHVRRLGGVEIGPRDLAFTPWEAHHLVAAVAGLELDDTQLERLMERTGGWPVGIQLASLALRDGGEPDAVLDGLSGADRHVAAFFHAHAWNDVGDPSRRFLLTTCVLDVLDPPVCQAVTDLPATRPMLELVMRQGLFVDHVDDTGTLRLHPLYRDFLRQQLRTLEPGVEGRLLVRAAGWHGDHGEHGRAARYLIEAERWDLLLQLVDVCGRSMFDTGAEADVLAWLDAIPHLNQAQWNGIDLRRAHLYSMRGETRRADQVLHEMLSRRPSPGERVIAQALESWWVFIDDIPERALRAATAAIEDLDVLDGAAIPDVFGLTEPISMQTAALTARGWSHWLLGDVELARADLTTVTREERPVGQWAVKARSALALLEAWDGNLPGANALAEDARLLAARAGIGDHPATAEAHLATACVLRHAGQVHDAIRAAEAAGTIAQRYHRASARAIESLERALLHLAAGAPDMGLAELETLRSRGDYTPPPLLADRLRATEIRLHLASDHLGSARTLLADAPRPLAPRLVGAGLQVAMADGDLDQCQATFDLWTAPPTGPGEALERRLWAAILELETGERRAAIRAAGTLATDAEASGHLRLFLDAGPAGERLLRTLMRRADLPAVRRMAPSGMAPVGAPAADPHELSDREREVARYLPTPLSSAEIAEALYISLNTLKTHLHAIYRKLGVHGRREAAAKAEELGIA